jgi:homoserine kinase
MALQAAQAFFRRAQRDTFGMQVFLVSQIPVARGLGASATLRLGLIAALNELTQAQLDRQQLLDLATSLEGHPDNASPAIYGGFTVSGLIGKPVRCLHFPVRSDVKFVTLVPHLRISTATARRLVPDSFSKADTLHSLNRAALISAAFASSDYAALRGLFDDRVHQPYREKLIPELSRTIQAAERAGAIGGWLSGSGSAIMCLTLDKAEVIANAMLGVLPDSQVKILSPDNHGFKAMER